MYFLVIVSFLSPFFHCCCRCGRCCAMNVRCSSVLSLHYFHTSVALIVGVQYSFSVNSKHTHKTSSEHPNVNVDQTWCVRVRATERWRKSMSVWIRNDAAGIDTWTRENVKIEHTMTARERRNGRNNGRGETMKRERNCRKWKNSSAFSFNTKFILKLFSMCIGRGRSRRRS